MRVGVVGATGQVGGVMRRMLAERAFPVDEIRYFASSRSAGSTLPWDGRDIVVEDAASADPAGLDIALFSAGASMSRVQAPRFAAAAVTVIDNSSAWRMDPDVPLVVAEVNASAARAARKGIIANPNCTTTVMLMALYPLHKIFRVLRVFASTYQAVSGSGSRGVEELTRQTSAFDNATADATPPAALSDSAKIFPHPIAFNLLPHVDSFLENGYTKEEVKMQDETRKIMHLPELRVSATCVRVPVYRAHSVAVTAEFERPVSIEQAREVLSKAPGLDFVDEPRSNQYPMPLNVAGKDNCQVGRVRLDCALENGLSFWVSGDQLLKGAALNAVQIAELL